MRKELPVLDYLRGSHDDPNLFLLEQLIQTHNLNEQVDKDGIDALKQFVSEDYYNNCREFIRRGINLTKGDRINTLDKKELSVLDHAENTVNYELLLAAGFDVSTADSKGQTQLAKEMAGLNFENVELLHKYGASQHYHDKDQKIPVDHIQRSSGGWKKRYAFAKKIKGIGFDISRYISAEKIRTLRTALFFGIFLNLFVYSATSNYMTYIKKDDFRKCYQKEGSHSATKAHVAACLLPFANMCRRRQQLKNLQAKR